MSAPPFDGLLLSMVLEDAWRGIGTARFLNTMRPLFQMGAHQDATSGRNQHDAMPGEGAVPGQCGRFWHLLCSSSKQLLH
jgi:hypothetical protein